MSTYLYLECLDHEPPLRADLESGQQLRALEAIRFDVRDRDAIVRLYDASAINYGNHFRANSAKFLADHRHCRIGIVSEYGERFTTGEDAEAAPAAPLKEGR